MSELERLTAVQRVEMYCEARPASPSAVRRPRLMKRGRAWVALLGPNLRDGISGFGSTVESALHSFDTQYLLYLRPPIAA